MPLHQKGGGAPLEALVVSEGIVVNGGGYCTFRYVIQLCLGSEGLLPPNPEIPHDSRRYLYRLAFPQHSNCGSCDWPLDNAHHHTITDTGPLVVSRPLSLVPVDAERA